MKQGGQHTVENPQQLTTGAHAKRRKPTQGQRNATSRETEMGVHISREFPSPDEERVAPVQRLSKAVHACITRQKTKTRASHNTKPIYLRTKSANTTANRRSRSHKSQITNFSLSDHGTAQSRTPTLNGSSVASIRSRNGKKAISANVMHPSPSSPQSQPQASPSPAAAAAQESRALSSFSSFSRFSASWSCCRVQDNSSHEENEKCL